MSTNGSRDHRETIEYGDGRFERGVGGETHQASGDGRPSLTTQQGVVVCDDQNTLRAGERGPAMLEDFHFREKIFHFDHERIPERVVHARGYGAHGFFENYGPLGELTQADLFQRAGERTPAFVRFSTVAGSKGSGDLARDVRGFAVKLYTKQGNWDLVGINAGDYPQWELGMQLFDDEFADRFAFDVLDPTKIIPEEEVPVRRVGRLVLDRVVDNFFAETEQVAFCTQNVVPGIDFTNDPLLQGRNFSYLDTQLKRLGSPNFTHLPVNAPKCPFATFQQDGHMATVNPVTRANYEPNSWSAQEGGPRENPAAGFTSNPAHEAGAKRRLRPESFADHYSQARQFYLSQTEIERRHIADAFTFELSKCDTPSIRERMVAGLRNVDEDLAGSVGDALGLRQLPDKASAARQVRTDLPGSPALSILSSGPENFGGRKIGVLVTNGADASVISGLRAAAHAEEAMIEFIGPVISGAEASDGSLIAIDQQVSGGPSVLYDAVVIAPSRPEVASLTGDPAARDFVTDAYAHCKFIGYVPDAEPLFEATGLAELKDEGFIEVGNSKDPAAFIAACRELRFWQRQMIMVS